MIFCYVLHDSTNASVFSKISPSGDARSFDASLSSEPHTPLVLNLKARVGTMRMLMKWRDIMLLKRVSSDTLAPATTTCSLQTCFQHLFRRDVINRF